MPETKIDMIIKARNEAKQTITNIKKEAQEIIGLTKRQRIENELGIKGQKELLELHTRELNHLKKLDKENKARIASNQKALANQRRSALEYIKAHGQALEIDKKRTAQIEKQNAALAKQQRNIFNKAHRQALEIDKKRTAQIEKQNAALAKQQSIAGRLGKFTGGIVGGLGIATGAGAFFAISRGLREATQAGLEFRRQMDSIQLSLETIGGAPFAERASQEIKNFAKESPLALQDVQQAFRKLYATGGDDLGTIENIRSIQNAAILAGASSEEFGRISYWLARMYEDASAGKAFGETLRHLRDFPGIFSSDMLNKLRGFSEEWEDLFTSGQMSAQQLMEMLFDDMDRFGDVTDKIGDHLNTIEQKFTESFAIMANSILENSGLLGEWKQTLQGITNLMDLVSGTPVTGTGRDASRRRSRTEFLSTNQIDGYTEKIKRFYELEQTLSNRSGRSISKLRIEYERLKNELDQYASSVGPIIREENDGRKETVDLLKDVYFGMQDYVDMMEEAAKAVEELQKVEENKAIAISNHIKRRRELEYKAHLERLAEIEANRQANLRAFMDTGRTGSLRGIEGTSLTEPLGMGAGQLLPGGGIPGLSSGAGLTPRVRSFRGLREELGQGKKNAIEFGRAMNELGNAIGGAEGEAVSFVGSIVSAFAAGGPVGGMIALGIGLFGKLAQKTKEAKAEQEAYNKKVDEFRTKMRGASGAVKEHIRNIRAAEQAYRSLTPAMKETITATNTLAQVYIDAALAGIQLSEAQKEIVRNSATYNEQILSKELELFDLRTRLMQREWDQRKEAAQEYYDEEIERINALKEAEQKRHSAAIKALRDEEKLAQKMHETRMDALDDQREAAEKAHKARVEQLDEEKDHLQKLLKTEKDRFSTITKAIDGINSKLTHAFSPTSPIAGQIEALQGMGIDTSRLESLAGKALIPGLDAVNIAKKYGINTLVDDPQSQFMAGMGNLGAATEAQAVSQRFQEFARDMNALLMGGADPSRLLQSEQLRGRTGRVVEASRATGIKIPTVLRPLISALGKGSGAGFGKGLTPAMEAMHQEVQKLKEQARVIEERKRFVQEEILRVESERQAADEEYQQYLEEYNAKREEFEEAREKHREELEARRDEETARHNAEIERLDYEAKLALEELEKKLAEIAEEEKKRQEERWLLEDEHIQWQIKKKEEELTILREIAANTRETNTGASYPTEDEPGEADESAYGSGITSAKHGTKGAKGYGYGQFGSGSPAILHGNEAIVPARGVGDFAADVANNLGIDYDKLAEAIRKNPPVVMLDGRKVSRDLPRVMSRGLLQKQAVRS